MKDKLIEIKNALESEYKKLSELEPEIESEVDELGGEIK